MYYNSNIKTQLLYLLIYFVILFSIPSTRMSQTLTLFSTGRGDGDMYVAEIVHNIKNNNRDVIFAFLSITLCIYMVIMLLDLFARALTYTRL